MAPLVAALPGWRLDRAAGGRLAHGLLFGEDRLPALRDLYARHPFFAPLRAEAENLDREALRRFMDADVRLNDQLTDLPRLGDDAERLALHALLTEEADAADLAASCVRTMMRFPKWDYFLDGDEVIGVQRAPAAAIAIALASDWLGDAVAEEERRAWLGAVAERGCLPCYRSLYDIANPRQVTGWRFDPESTITTIRAGNDTDLNRRPEITADTNLRAIPAAGLVVGAAAVADFLGDTPQTDAWLQMGADTVRAFGAIYRPDGSYHEGVSYAHYTSENLVQAITVLQRKRGLDLQGAINWEGHVDYLLNLALPTHADPAEIVNFGDNGNPKTGQPGAVRRTAVPFWIARATGSARAQWLAENRSGTPDLRALLYFDSRVSPQAPPAGPVLWESDLDWIVARTGYAADDLVVAMRSGGPANHEHADRNSLIVKAFGEQLVTDPYRPPYSFADPAWSMRLTHAHSAVLIDGRGHEHHNGVEGTNASQSAARILFSEQREGAAIWSSDATQPYRLVDVDVGSVVRSVAVLYDVPAVVVVDRVTKRRAASAVQARFFGFNWDGRLGHEVSGNRFTVRRPHAVLHGTSVCPQGQSVRLGRLDVSEERARRHPFVEVEVPPALETLLVTVLAMGRDEASVPRPEVESGEGVIVRFGPRRVVVAPDGALAVS